MLEKAPGEFARLDLDDVAVDVEAAHEYLVRTQHLDVQTRDAEASLVVDPLATGLDDLRVDDHHGLVVHVPHEDLLLHTDLGRSEADARVAVVQRVEHVVDQTGDLAVDLGDRGSLRLQYRITEGPDRVAHACQATHR